MSASMQTVWFDVVDDDADEDRNELVAELRRRAALLAVRCADAEAEYDAAVDAGQAMYFLVQRDREVDMASRRHREVLADLARLTATSRRPVLTGLPRR